MGFFGLVFWLAVAWLAFRAFRRRERWAMMGPRSYGRYSGWYDSSEFCTPGPRGIEPKSREQLQDQQKYIDSLETRVSELEERLDFTERLVAGRGQAAS
jgi:hypothetical protein